MAQTTTATNTTNAVLEGSANGTTWTDISGSTNKIEAPTQDVDTGDVATLDGAFKIPKVGKVNPLELNVTVLYTETAGEAMALMHQQWAVAGKTLYLRWTPAARAGVAARRYYTADSNGNLAAGVMTSFNFPGANAEEASATLLTFKLKVITLSYGAGPSSSASKSPSASASA